MQNIIHTMLIYIGIVALGLSIGFVALIISMGIADAHPQHTCHQHTTVTHCR